MYPKPQTQIAIIGAGIGGLTVGVLLAQAGYGVTIFEAQTYPGGSAGTYTHKGYRFDAGATVAGGFQPGGPHDIVGKQLGITWPLHQHDPAWVVHLPNRQIALTRHYEDVLMHFPQTARFWQTQQKTADLAWKLSGEGLPWPPKDLAEAAQLAKVGLKNFPHDLRLLPFAFSTVKQWMVAQRVAHDPHFVRFIDAQLLIAAQTTSENVNALYGAAALDLTRQGVYHVEGGIGGLAQTLVRKIEDFGGTVLYRQNVTRIAVENGRVKGVYVRKGKHGMQEDFFLCDFLIANLTPWSLADLLGGNSPARLRQEVAKRENGWGAFVLHLGIQGDGLLPDMPDHHQMLSSVADALGEGRSIFLSLSPQWDTSRAPAGHRAVTITTHTDVQSWWRLLKHDPQAYGERKALYTERILKLVDRYLPAFRGSIRLLLPGTPVTYNFYTNRHLGMVGGFPQTSLFTMRSPRTGIRNLRLVGDSIFPGQSTAGVTLGALRVAVDVQRQLGALGVKALQRVVD